MEEIILNSKEIVLKIMRTYHVPVKPKNKNHTYKWSSEIENSKI